MGVVVYIFQIRDIHNPLLRNEETEEVVYTFQIRGIHNEENGGTSLLYTPFK